MPKDGGIAASTKRREDIRFLTGNGNYTDDINLGGQACVHFLRSDVAHGRLRKVDTSAAEARRGFCRDWRNPLRLAGDGSVRRGDAGAEAPGAGAWQGAPCRRSVTCQTPCAHNPLGVKGCGEAGTISSPPAVVNAVVDALRSAGHDITHIDMPLTPSRVWAAMQR